MRALLIAILLLLATPAAAKVNVFACEPEWAALAQEIGGPDIEVFTATTARQDPHHIDARPALVARMRSAQFLICTGADLEIAWLPTLLRQSGNGGVPRLMVADHFQLLDRPATLDRAQGDIHAAGNPHLHLDPRVLRTAAALLADRLALLDKPRAAQYRARLASFQQRLDQALVRWEQRSTPLIGTRVITHHKSFTYLFGWLGIADVANLEPKPGIPPGAAHLVQLIANAPQLSARMVIHAAYQDGRAAEFVAGRTGLPVVNLPYTVGGSDRATDLFGLFDDTIDRLLAARL